MKKIFTFLCLFFLWAGSSWGQSAIIGTGTSLSDGSGYDPVERYYNYEHYQIIYTAAELTAAGMPAGASITALGFSISESAVSLANYTIKMGLTAQATAQPYISTLTTVVNPFTYAPVVQAAGSFDMIPFTTNFTWDGVSNIVVNTCTGSNPFTTPYGGLRYTSSTSGLITYVRTDGTDNCATTSLASSVEKPNIKFNYFVPPPCSSPLAQPTSLLFSAGTTYINVSYTASASADDYLVIRSLNSSLSATPVNGTVYPVGSVFGGGVVDYFGTAVSYSSTGLTPNTPYYYYVFATNHSTCSGGPLYRTTSPLSGSQATLPLVPLTGTKTVGPTGDFFSLTAAFAYLSGNGVSGPLNLVLQSTYVSSVETFPVLVSPVSGTGAVNKISVYPSATGLSITSSNTTGTVNLNGANYVTFDGRVNATGTTRDLVIENSSTSGFAVQFVNGASNNTFKYCTAKGASANYSTGVFTFGGTTASTGNNYNVVDNCEIRDGVSTPWQSIYSAGSAIGSQYNSFNTVSNCLIHDFYIPAGGTPFAIGCFGSTAWTISGNSIYAANTQSPTTATTVFGIYIGSGDGYTVTNNYIGGSAALCGGTPWTISGTNLAHGFYGIDFATGGLTTNASLVQGNTIANLLLSASSASTGSIRFVGIISLVGIQNINNNTFGSATGTGSISINVGTGAFTSTYEGIDFRGLYGNITNNTFGSFTLTGTAAYTLTVRPFSVTPTVQNGPASVSGNLAGSLTTANSIQATAQAIAPVQIQSMFVSSTGNGSMSVANNTVANVTNLAATTTSHIVGIYSAGTAIPNVVSNNTIRDLTTTSTSTTVVGIASVNGIYSLNSVPGSVIRSNSIYNLTNTSATASVGAHGMYLGHANGNLLVEKNFIHNVALASSSATSQVDGIYSIIAGTYCTFKNNMIQLGVNPDGSANTSNCVINGIYESSSSLDSLLYNTIYIGGSPGGVTGSTYAYNSVMTPSLSTPRVVLGNIFYNARSGGSTGKHYGIKIAGTTLFPLGVTSNYNLILANGATGGTFGYYNSLDQATFAAYKTATGNEMASGSSDPNFIAPNGTGTTANLHVQSPTPIEASGIALANVTDDFDGALRSGLTPSDVGADAGSFTLSADVFAPNITYTPIGNGTTANRVLTGWATITDNVGVATGANLPRLYYKKATETNAFGLNNSTANGWKYVTSSNSISPFSFTIDYSLLTAPAAAGDNIQYFVVAQDAANNLSSNYLMAGSSANPPVQNINAAPQAPASLQSYNIVAATIPTTINVPGTYPTLTGTGGAFEAINAGVLAGNTTINIAGDLTEPGTNALNAWAEDVPGANYTLTIKPDASTLRTISGTAVATGVAMIRTNGASRFTIDGQAGKLLTFRSTNATAGNTGPTIQFNGGSQSCFLKNCTIENNGTTTTYGSVNVGSTGLNSVEINGNDIRDASAGTIGVQTTGIYNASFTNSIKVLNNNIYNFKNYGVYFTTVADGAIITGNSFYYNSATASSATQYGIYVTGSSNNHAISNNYIGGQAPLCGGAAWTNSTTNTIYGIYFTPGIITRSAVSNNTVQNFNLSNTGSASFYGIYITAGVLNVLNNTVGSSSLSTSVTCAGTGGFYGVYVTPSATAVNNVQGNVVSGISYTNTANLGTFYFLYLSTGLFNVGTTSPNVIGSNSAGSSSSVGSITYAGTGTLYGIYCSSTNPGNAIENNIIGNWSLTATSGSPYARGMYIYSANVRKNKIFNISCTNATVTPYIYGIYNYNATGVTNEYSNNLVSLDAGAATNPVIYGYYDYYLYSAFYNLYHNTFSVSGPATGTSNTYAIYRGSLAFYTLNDNIFSNKRLAGGTGKHYAEYVVTTGGCSANNNDLYSTAGPLGYYTADQATLAAFRNATGNDANSLNVDPQFVSTSDLHTARPEMNNSGVAVPAVTTDYTGATRTNPPDIGAFEYSLAITDINTLAATAITKNSATLNGNINTNNEIVAMSFDYGLTTSYTGNIAGSPTPVQSVASVSVSSPLSGLTANTLYHYRIKGASTTSAEIKYGLDMTFVTLPDPTVASGPTSACINSTGNIYTTQAGNSGYVWVVTGGTITSGAGTAAITVTWNTAGAQSVSVNYNNSDGFPALTPGVYNVLVNPNNTVSLTSAAGTTSQTICVNTAIANITYSTTSSTGATITGLPSGITGVWASNVVTISGTPSATGTFNYTVTLTGGCGNITSGGTITVNPNAAIALTSAVGTNAQSKCVNSAFTNITYSVSGGGTGAGVTGLPAGVTGTYAAGVVTISGTPTAAGVYNYTVTTTGTCVQATAIGTLTVYALPFPTLTGPATPLAGSTGNVYTTEAGMTNYIWTVSAGGTITVGGTSTSNTVTVTWNTASPQTVTVTYTNGNGCSAAAPTVYNINNALPGAAGPITGSPSVCAGQSGVSYSVGLIASATGYAWTLPTGATIATGANTNSITVNFAESAVSGNITVYGTNGTGNGPVSPVYAVTVNPRPAPSITGPANTCLNVAGNVYTTQAGMTGYVWTVSAGGTITAGSGTNAITVTWTTLGSKTVSVNYINSNGCTAIAATVYNVTVNALPVPFISGNSNACQNGAVVYSTDASMTGYTWAVSSGGTITAGSGTNTITVLWNTLGAQTVSVNFTNGNGCTALTPTVFNVTVNARPATPSISGPATACFGSTGNIYTSAAGMSAYVWTVPGGTITAGAGTNTITVTWTTAGAQAVTLNVANASACAASTPGSFTTTVGPQITVNAVTSQVVCNGSPTTGVTLSSPVTGTTFNWVNSNTGIGLAASGQGSLISSFNAVNNGGTPVVASVTVTPYGPGVAVQTFTGTFAAGDLTLTANRLTRNAVASTCAAPKTFPGNNPGGPYYYDTYNLTNTSGSTQCVNVSYVRTGTTGDVFVTAYTGSFNPADLSVNYLADGGGSSVSTTPVAFSFNLTNGSTVVLVANAAVASTPCDGYSITVTGLPLPGCPGTPSTFTYTVNPTPTVNPVSNQNVCKGSSTSAVTFGSNVAGTTFSWTNSNTAIGLAASGTGNIPSFVGTNAGATAITGVITVTPSAYTNASVTCTGAPLTFQITVNPIPVPTIAGPTSLCAGSTGITYTTEAGNSNYSWTISYDGIITSGLNTNTITVNWPTAGSRYVAVNYTNAGGCGAVAPTYRNVTVLTVPVPMIFGETAVCQGSTGVTYTTQAGNSNYVWAVSTGGTITSGAGTASIKVTWTAGGNQTVSVNYTNAGGCSAVQPTVYNVAVAPLPAAGGTITGPASVCAGSQGVSYTVAAIANATTYSWTVPTGATIATGATTNSITVNFDATAVSGIIKVNGVNSCGNGASSPNFSVTVNPVPATPVITKTGSVLSSSAATGNQWYRNGVLIAGATAQQFTPVYLGTYTVIVTVGGCSSAVSNAIVITAIVGTADLEVSHSFDVYPNPSKGAFNVKVVSGKPVILNIEIYNNLGAIQWKQENVHIDGTYITPIDLGLVPAGIYMVALRNSELNLVRKIVIMK